MESHTPRTASLIILALALTAASGICLTRTSAQTPAASAPAPAPAPAPTTATSPSVPATQPASTQPSVQAASPVEAGKYLLKIGGCHDCHTPGWTETAGESIPEEKLLTGLAIGFRGPWGTTYGSNLRAFANSFVEDDFIKVLRARNTRPPMPWSAIHAMSDTDLRAMYKYLKSLKPIGKPAPAFVPAGVEPQTPYVVLDPSLAPAAYTLTTKPATTTAPTTAPAVVKPARP